jgi:predicted acylesterase/phospholipase RssA
VHDPVNQDTSPSKRDVHLFGPGPKRILSLDGGGVRGIATIAFLEEIERKIEEIEGHPVLLCDWFDLIGGTSTGAIIATALCLGYRASEIRTFYEQLAPRVFRTSYFRLWGWQARFDSRRLARELVTVIGTRALDSPDLRTGLCIVLKRMDTGSSWIVVNNPHSAFWEKPADGSFTGNRHLPLANIVRASTAAPTFFDPELIEIVAGKSPGLFVDGALTAHNNPSLLMLLTAIIPAYGLNWKLGPENLLVVSVGTGTFRTTLSSFNAARSSAISLAFNSLSAMITETQLLVLTLMTFLGQSLVPWHINSEIGDLGGIKSPLGDMFRFLRYDLTLEAPWLIQKLQRHFSADFVSKLQPMDDPRSMEVLYELGRSAAADQVKREDLMFASD